MLLLIGVATAISLVLAIYGWRSRRVPGSKQFVCLTLACAWWSSFYGLELSDPTLSGKILWNNIKYIGILAASPAWLALVLHLTNQSYILSRRNLALIGAAAGSLLAIIWTNDWHGQWRTSAWLETIGSLTVLRQTSGYAFWLAAGYSYSLLVIGTGLLLAMYLHSQRLYRRQASILLVGAAIPWVSNVLYVFGFEGLPRIDLTPFGFTLTGLCVAWGLYRYRLLDILPIARDAVFDSLKAGAIVIDEQDRLIDLNSSAQLLIGSTATEAIGKPVREVLAGWPALVASLSNLETSGVEASNKDGGPPRYIDMTISPLYDRRQQLGGRLIVLRDVTERRAAEEALRVSAAQIQTLLDAEQRHARELTLIDQVRTTLAREVDLPIIVHTIVESIADVIGYSHVSIYLRDGHDLRLQHQVGYDTVIERFAIGLGVSSRVLLSGKSVLLADVRSDPTFLGAIDGITSEVCVPIFDQDQAVGILNVESVNGIILGESDLRLMEGLGQQVSIAIARARLYDEVRENEQKFRELAEHVNEAFWLSDADLSQTLYMSPAYERVFGKKYGDAVKAPTSFLADVHPDDRARVTAAQEKKLRGEYDEEFRIYWPDGSLHWVHSRAFPIRDEQGRVYRIAGVSEEVTERREAAEKLESRARELALLNDTTRDLAGQQSIDGVTHTIAERSAALMYVPNVSVYLWVPEEERLLLAAQIGSLLLPTSLPWGEGVVGQVAMTREHLIVNDYANWEHHLTSPGLAAQPLAVLAVPLHYANRLMGVLVVSEPRVHRAFNDTDSRLLSLFAHQAASAIHNARLFGELQRLARTDELTGVYNRRHLFELGEFELVRARRHKHPLAVIMLDIDHFKAVNDQYGHAFGDRVLRAVADCCLQDVRGIDIVGRYGGEEFALILSETTATGAQYLAERIRRHVAAQTVRSDQTALQVTISLGIAEADSERDNLAHLLDRADQALYAAKQAGRNCVRIAASEPAAHLTR